MKDIIAKIAKEHLSIETLELQGRDRLDFHDCSVGGISRALEAAYAAGFSRGIARNRPLIAAADELIGSIMAAREHWDTGALDELEPASTRLLQRVEAAKKALKRARAP